MRQLAIPSAVMVNGEVALFCGSEWRAPRISQPAESGGGAKSAV